MTNFQQWSQVFQLLQVYKVVFSEKLNTAKTTIFSARTQEGHFQNHICSLVGVAATKGYDKYLGLPAFVGRSKLKAFAAIQGRVLKLLDGWKERFLSQTSKKVLIKAVIQAVLTYNMCIFQLP